MISYIIQQLKAYGCTEVVYSETGLQMVVHSIYDNDRIHMISDVRSATFFAFGQAKMICGPILLLVDERYISNCYTALMEAWMQRVQIIIVAYNSLSERTTTYLERCLDFVYVLHEPKSLPVFGDAMKSFAGPILLKTSWTTCDTLKTDYSKILVSLLKLTPGNGILCYNAIDENLLNSGVINIDVKYKYGILSKYIGMLKSGKQYYLCVPDYILLLESNVFCLRNFPATFKVFLIQTDEKILGLYEKWICSNRINLVWFDNNSEISKVANSSCPTLFVMR